MAAAQQDAPQEPISGMGATKVKLTRIPADQISPDELPAIEDRMVLTLSVVCTGRGMEKLRTGEQVPTARLEVLTLDVESGPTKPQTTPSLFKVEGDGDDD